MEKDLKQIRKIIFKNLQWIRLFFCITGFLLLAEDVFDKDVMKGDVMGYKIISTYLISDFATPQVF